MQYPVPSSAVETPDGPTLDPVLVTQVMAHCKAEVSDDYQLFAGWIAAATALVESQSGLLLSPRQVVLTFDAFPDCGRPLELPVRPVQSVASVVYRDAAGDEQALTGFGTWLAKELVGAPDGGWPATKCDGMAAVTVTAVAGHMPEAVVPAQAVQAIKLICGYWNGFRGDGKDPNQYPQTIGIPAGAERLIRQLRRREYR